MNAKLDNPAGRLLDLIVRGQQIPSNKESRAAWCELLCVDPADTPRLTMRMGKVMGLVDEIKTAVHSCKNIRPETYLSFASLIDKAFRQQRFSGDWGSFINHLDKNVINYIEMTSDLLSMQRSEGVIEDDQLEDIEKNIQVLSKEIESSKIDDELKNFLFRSFNRILEAIQEYRFTGVRGLYEAIYSTIGEISVTKGMSESLKKTYTGKKFGELIGKIFFVLKLRDSNHQLPASIMSMVPEADFIIDDKDIKEV